MPGPRSNDCTTCASMLDVPREAAVTDNTKAERPHEVSHPSYQSSWKYMQTVEPGSTRCDPPICCSVPYVLRLVISMYPMTKTYSVATGEPDQAQAGCGWRMLRSADHTALLHLKPAHMQDPPRQEAAPLCLRLNVMQHGGQGHRSRSSAERTPAEAKLPQAVPLAHPQLLLDVRQDVPVAGMTEKGYPDAMLTAVQDTIGWSRSVGAESGWAHQVDAADVLPKRCRVARAGAIYTGSTARLSAG